MNEPDPAAGGRQPTEEELHAAMEEQMRRIRVQDVVLQTVATLINLGGRRLGLAPEAADERDLDQVRMAIEGTRALVPLLGEEEKRAVREPLSQLQMAYAREVGGADQTAAAGAETGAGESGPPPADEQRASPGEQPRQPTREEAERAKARSRIWTPPGA